MPASFEQLYTDDEWLKARPADCLCYVPEFGRDANGRNRPSRVMLCPLHGDPKATGGKKARTTAKDERSPKGQLKRSPLNAVSDKEEFSKAYLQGVKDALITQMLQGGGQVWCQSCEEDQQGATSLEKARTALDLHHHDQERDEGPRYNHKTRNPGRDNPVGLLLLCRPCHKRLGEK